MPVHIDHHYVDGNAAVAELLAQGQELLVAVCPVAAPPVSENKLGRHGDLACNLGEIGQGGFVVVSVSEDVKVLDLTFRTYGYPLAPVAVVGNEEVTGTLVYDGPAIPGKDAEFHGVVVVDMVWPGATVQGAGRTHQVARGFKAGMPGDGLSIQLERYGKIVLREFSALVGQCDRGSADGGTVTAPCGGELGNGKIAVDYGEGCVILETAVL